MLKSAHSSRLVWLDTLRGIAILLMVMFHFCYDLRYFSYVDWAVPNGDGWRHFRYVILSLFIFSAGFSLSLAYRTEFYTIKFIRHIAVLLISAICITSGSLFLFSDAWIYFGVLHFLVVACVVSVLFVQFSRLALCIACVLLLGSYVEWFPRRWPFYFFDHLLPMYTEDFVPLFPWLGVMLLGVGAAGFRIFRDIKVADNFLVALCAWLGKRSLFVYLLHQPILFSCFIGVSKILK